MLTPNILIEFSSELFPEKHMKVMLRTRTALFYRIEPQYGGFSVASQCYIIEALAVDTRIQSYRPTISCMEYVVTGVVLTRCLLT